MRWTLLGSSEHGPERAFWRSFTAAAGAGEGDAVAFLGRLLREAYGENAGDASGLAALGLRILPSGPHHPQPEWAEDPPSWAARLSLGDEGPFEGVRYLLTFRPFASLPEDARRRYLAGDLHLLPFPGSLAFWGMPTFLGLAGELPAAMQLPLLRLTRRHQGPGIRIPQSGWLHEPGPAKLERELHDAYMRETFTRTHRWDRVLRHENELDILTHADRVARVLFSTDLATIGLYDKPMARNAQLWTNDFRRVLDGPQANAEEIAAARDRVLAGGTFGYRFHYPAMRVGGHEVVWHRPLVAFVPPGADTPTVLDDGPLGYLVASPDAAGGDAIELFPRLLRRPLELAAVTEIRRRNGGAHEAANVLALAAAWRGLGERPLPRSFARRLLKLGKNETVEAWLEALPGRAADPETGRRVRAEIEALLETLARRRRPMLDSLTYASTATRAFEEAYWRDIATLAHGRYLTKDNADCVLDPVTRAHEPHDRRDLEALGDYLIERHRQAIAAAGMAGKALCGELPFAWRTDFPFADFGGWLANQEGQAHERDIVVVIPGRDRRQAVILADHYDTAYMEDVYDTSKGGSGARLAAHGADDNHSATATLLQAAPMYLELAQAGAPGARRLARPPHRRGVPRRLHGRPRPLPGAHGARHGAARGGRQRGPLGHAGRRPRGDGHDRPQPRLEPVRLPDRARRRPRRAARRARRPTSPTRRGTPSPRSSTRRPSGAAAAPAPAAPTPRSSRPWPRSPACGARCACTSSRAARCTTPTDRSSPTSACRRCCSWRTTTSTARATTTPTTRWRTSTSTTAPPSPPSPSKRSPASPRRRQGTRA